MSFGLCRMCIYYKPIEKTCSRSVLKSDMRHHEIIFAPVQKVRTDETACGIDALWFTEIPKNTPNTRTDDSNL